MKRKHYKITNEVIKNHLSQVDFNSWITVLIKRNQGLSLSSVGKYMGITKQRVSVIEKKIEKRLGKPLSEITVEELKELQDSL